MSPLSIFKTTFKDFNEDQCTLRAAALSYYTIFALPPLLILILKLVSLIWNRDDVNSALHGQFAAMIGDNAAGSLQSMFQSGESQSHRGALGSIAAFAALAFGATGAFGQLQGALNRAWEVRADPKAGLTKTILKRIFSFGMVLGVAFMLLVSLAVSAALQSFGGALTSMLPQGLGETFLHVVEFIVSFGIITLLFALMFKFIPDAEIEWRDVWTGAAVTALLFTVGKFVIGLYLGHSHPGQAYGAASALAVLLVWVYYSGIIVLLGAEFTQTLTEARGRHIVPAKGAVRLEEFGKEKDARAGAGAKDARPADAGQPDRAVSLQLPDGSDLHLLHRIVTIPKRVLNRYKRL
jgi:membrane protein